MSPTIGLLTFNALRAAREALIPVETGFFSLRGAEKQWNTIQRMITHIGRPIACHLLPTLHKPQSQLACNILAALRRQFAGQILPVVIHEDEALREAASFGQPVLEYAPQSQAMRDFDQLADWLEEHAANPTVFIEVLTQQELLHPGTGTPTGPGQTLPTSSTALGGRAAELARRVHNLTGRTPSDSSRPVPSISAASAADIDSATIVTSVSAPSEIAIEQESLSMVSELMPPIMPMVDVIVGNEMSSAATASPIQVARIEHHDSGSALCLEPDVHPSPTTVPPDLSHLYGVRMTSRGVLFIQPASTGRLLSIAGDFNHWSAASTPMRLDEHTGVFQIIVPLPPGMHQYRIVADGEWIPDPHNPHTQLNSYGEPNSVFVVP